MSIVGFGKHGPLSVRGTEGFEGFRDGVKIARRKRGERRRNAMRWYVWAMAGVLAAGAGIGCDDKTEVPPEVLRAKEQQERERRQAALPATKPSPTTQQLMAEERRTLKLGSF